MVKDTGRITIRHNRFVGLNVAVHSSQGTVTSGSVGLNCIEDSRLGAVQEDSATLALDFNWWGHASGPGGVGPGDGVPVSGDVEYLSFLTGTPESCFLGRTVRQNVIAVPTLSWFGFLMLASLFLLLGSLVMMQKHGSILL